LPAAYLCEAARYAFIFYCTLLSTANFTCSKFPPPASSGFAEAIDGCNTDFRVGYVFVANDDSYSSLALSQASALEGERD